jgi:hypothetical protein
VLGLLEPHLEVLNKDVEGGTEVIQLGQLQVLDLDVAISDVLKIQFMFGVGARQAAGGHHGVGTFPPTALLTKSYTLYTFQTFPGRPRSLASLASRPWRSRWTRSRGPQAVTTLLPKEITGKFPQSRKQALFSLLSSP